jgi:hypothetical protein
LLHTFDFDHATADGPVSRSSGVARQHVRKTEEEFFRSMVIMTGSIIPTKFVNATSEVRFVRDDLGEVSLRILP